ncbi:MAG TPA: sulfurtransferase TusA family protein [Deltaproteobacteria bacterium]|nr:sulfurtransferase TusA family protein [Deltaproteobacteria bacterium]HPP81036.1 sulfurtransferase TusA family protein [Deltaproteobacteria bacterium]
MSTTVDARGLSCPQPVILTMEKIKELGTGEFTVLVDTDTSKENVSRAAASKGWEVKDIQPDGEGYRITLKKG